MELSREVQISGLEATLAVFETENISISPSFAIAGGAPLIQGI
jgi:hypothetical protein